MVDNKGSRAAGDDFVFLNVPYSERNENQLVALTAALIAVGRTPCLTLQLPDRGEGRLRRTFALLKSCSISIHDLSFVGTPVRFNMPFELGIACAIKERSRRHSFLILVRKPHQLLRYLSDMNGIDTIAHYGTVSGTISAVLCALVSKENNPTTESVLRLHRRMLSLLPRLKATHGSRFLFNTQVYSDLVWFGWELSYEMDLN